MTHAEALRLFVEGDNYQWVDACGLAILRFNGDKKALLAAARGSYLAQIGVLETTVEHRRWYFLVPEVRFEWLTCGIYPCSPGGWRALVNFLQVHLRDILPRASKMGLAIKWASKFTSIKSTNGTRMEIPCTCNLQQRPRSCYRTRRTWEWPRPSLKNILT